MQQHFINIHSHSKQSNTQDLILRSVFPWDIEEMFQLGFSSLSIGLHPWHVHQDNTGNLLQEIEKQARHPHILAIGEVGLDRFAEASMEEQVIYFTKQAKIAELAQKPLIIHCVRCFPELLAVKKKLAPTCPWIIHGFQGNHQIAKELIRKGCYLSFGEALLNDKVELLQAFRIVPIDKIFLETDESEVEISEIFIRAAILKNISLEELQKQIQDNFEACFAQNS